MALSFDQFMDLLRCETGSSEDTAGTLRGYWNRIRRKHVTWRFVSKRKAGAGLDGSTTRMAQTGSTSGTQPILESAVYVTPTACTLVAAYFSPDISYTVSVSDCVQFQIIGRLRGSSASSATTSYSQTFGLATLSSTVAAFVPNRANTAIQATLEATTPGNLDLPALSTIGHKAIKNSVVANGSAQALPGTWTLVFEEN